MGFYAIICYNELDESEFEEVKMRDLEYLEYSAKEPMTLLRKMFNNGAAIYKTSPTTLTAEDASAHGRNVSGSG